MLESNNDYYVMLGGLVVEEQFWVTNELVAVETSLLPPKAR